MYISLSTPSDEIIFEVAIYKTNQKICNMTMIGQIECSHLWSLKSFDFEKFVQYNFFAE